MKLEGISKSNKFSKLLVALIDISLIIFGYYVAFMLRYNFKAPTKNFKPFIMLIPAIMVVSFISLNVYELFNFKRNKFSERLYSIVLSVTLINFFTMSAAYIFRGFAFPRTVFFIGYFIHIIFLLIWKSILFKYFKDLHGIKTVMIIGSKKSVYNIASKIINSEKDWYDVKYIFNIKDDIKMKNYIKEVDTVIITTGINYSKRKEIVKYCNKYLKELLIVPNNYELYLLNAKIDQLDDILTVRIGVMELSEEQRLIKRVIDIIISLIGILITLPIMLLVSLVIKFDSKGNILFKQERLTIGEKPFNLYKFRTMVENAEELTGPILAQEHDPRITKVGNILRLTRLDELPQLFNVLIGDMSIVGPRPERPFFVKKYKDSIPDYNYRMNVKAGITGLAQVLGKYATNFEDKLKYDLLYINNYSILLDLKLMLQTVKIVLIKDKSEGTKEIKNNSVIEEIIATSLEEISNCKLNNE